MQGYSWSAKAKNQRWMLSATKQAISVKRATTLGHVLRDLDFAKCLYGLIILFEVRLEGIEGGLLPERNRGR